MSNLAPRSGTAFLRGALAWLILVPWLGWAMIRIPGIERGFPAVPLIAYTPFLAATSVIPVIASLVLRSRTALLASMVVMLLLASTAAPRAFSGPSPEIDPSGPQLKVMTSNIFIGTADVDHLLDIATREGVDVLAIQELTPEALTRLTNAGINSEFQYSSVLAADGGLGSGIFSRFPVGPASDGFRLAGHSTDEAAAGTISISGAPSIELLNVHPPSPRRSASVAGWETYFGRLPGADPDGALRIMLGDFNATLDHKVLRRLLDTGFVDAADSVGQGFTSTWPAGQKFPPPVTIDHVLVDRRVAVTDIDVFTIPGTDHRAVAATLQLPTPAEAQP